MSNPRKTGFSHAMPPTAEFAQGAATEFLHYGTEGTRQVRRKVQFYNLDLILTKKGEHNAA